MLGVISYLTSFMFENLKYGTNGRLACCLLFKYYVSKLGVEDRVFVVYTGPTDMRGGGNITDYMLM